MRTSIGILAAIIVVSVAASAADPPGFAIAMRTAILNSTTTLSMS